MALEHTAEVMLVLDWVPFEHTTSENTIAVLVVPNDFVNSCDTSGDTATGRFHHFLENRKVEVVEETNRDIDWVTGKSLNHLDDGRCVEGCDNWVTCLHGLESSRALNTTNFTDDDVTRTATKCCLEQIEHLDTRFFIL